ncbi:MAG: zinc ribbon domain-containing protein [Methanobrevibacter sp.]|uniref:zinc ribbon domain-containing protein n=1 Tax=Methanobrevibacter sp. TaxID=66852 RepID=UPI0025DC397B|nr:zinc ribbon domain-containing protein [Methanobrevibacter sp.]MBQ8016590.1 zinc ribbon domain-containing protein [Methanobrevibacter sp.]
MKCSNCGFENKDKAKFCTKCGNSLIVKPTESVPAKSNNSKYLIIGLIAIIIILIATIGYFALNTNSDSVVSNENSQNADSQNNVQSVGESDNEANEESDSAKTTTVSSSKTSTTTQSDSKEWVSIGSYSGKGSGSETINVPEGKIMVKLSAYPIKNYATNHLYVTGSNGESGGVDWGSKSAVETRSDSFTYTSSSEEIFTIDYYETVNWEVEFFRYQ